MWRPGNVYGIWYGGMIRGVWWGVPGCCVGCVSGDVWCSVAERWKVCRVRSVGIVQCVSQAVCGVPECVSEVW